MTTAIRTVALETATICVTATATLDDRIVDADGHSITVGSNLHESLKIEGIKDGKVLATGSRLIWTDADNPWDAERVKKGIVARFDKVGLQADSAAKVQAAIEEAVAEVTTDDIAAHKAQVAAAQDADAKAEARVAASRDRVYRAMDADPSDQ